ncbi:MAG: hypothetical protein LBC80_02380, partial [Treponema sp.]|nr:hypothetical protein [Treponema sp.]
FENAFTKESIEVLDLYVYNLGFSRHATGGIPFATVISMLKSVISLTLLFTVNGLSKLFRGQSIV